MSQTAQLWLSCSATIPPSGRIHFCCLGQNWKTGYSLRLLRSDSWEACYCVPASSQKSNWKWLCSCRKDFHSCSARFCAIWNTFPFRKFKIQLPTRKISVKLSSYAWQYQNCVSAIVDCRLKASFFVSTHTIIHVTYCDCTEYCTGKKSKVRKRYLTTDSLRAQSIVFIIFSLWSLW